MKSMDASASTLLEVAVSTLAQSLLPGKGASLSHGLCERRVLGTVAMCRP
jgi:hypothetical protein